MLHINKMEHFKTMHNTLYALTARESIQDNNHLDMSSSWFPSSITPPCDITAILSALRTVVRRWATTRVVRRFCACRLSRAAWTCNMAQWGRKQGGVLKRGAVVHSLLGLESTPLDTAKAVPGGGAGYIRSVDQSCSATGESELLWSAVIARQNCSA